IDTGNIQGLESDKYTSFTDHNAVGETIQTTDPDGNITRPTYYLNGWEKALDVNYKEQDSEKSAVSFTEMKYNARGQSVFVRSGNGTTTTHTYEPTTFRLVGIKTLGISDNKVLQDLTYTYDPVGNVTGRTRNHIDTVFFNGQAVDGNSEYTHDSLYRLVKATGREHIGTFQKYQQDMFKRSSVEHYQPVVQPLSNGTALQRYSETYQYDAGGNLTEKRHVGPVSSSTFIRSFGIDNPDGTPRSNRIKQSSLKNTMPSSSGDSITYTQDENGNQTNLEGLRGIIWNERNNLDSVVLIDRSSAGKPNDQEYYQYDAGGQRTRKVFERLHDGDKQWIDEVIYLGNYEIRRRKNKIDDETVTTVEDYRVVRIQANGGAVIWRYQAKKKASTSPAESQKRYQLQDHLNSSTQEVDQEGQVITYQEYYPYGGTSIMAAQSQTEVKSKYYRYSFKERDNTTGLYYYGMRYYCTWLGRWMSPDPAGTVDGLNLYAFVEGNPVTLVDVGGMSPPKKKQKVASSSEEETSSDSEESSSESYEKITAKKRKEIGREKREKFRETLTSKARKWRKIGQSHTAEILAGPTSVVVGPNSGMSLRRKLLRHLSTAILSTNPEMIEVQAAMSETSKTIYIASNKRDNDIASLFKKDMVLRDFKVPNTSEDMNGRVKSHISQVSNEIKPKALGAYKVVIITGTDGQHAETKIIEQVDNLTIDYIAGTRRPCAACYLALKASDIKESAYNPHHGAFWDTDAAGMGLARFSPDEIKQQTISNNYYQNEGLVGQKRARDYDTDSTSGYWTVSSSDSSSSSSS
ncbi:MAG: RHS repeat-associated core domain-containing protein, partial [Crocosphaera sp.]